MRTQKLKRPAATYSVTPKPHTSNKSSIFTIQNKSTNTVKNQRRRAAPPYSLNASSSKSHPTAKKKAERNSQRTNSSLAARMYT